MDNNNHKGGNTIFGIIIIFFIVVGLLFVLKNIGEALLEFTDENSGIVALGFFITLFYLIYSLNKS